jgi:hypothetical protein
MINGSICNHFRKFASFSQQVNLVGSSPKYIQPTLKQLSDARGGNAGGYHFNPVTTWRIQREGKVLFTPEAKKLS